MKIIQKLLRIFARLVGFFLLFQVIIRFLRKRLHFPAPAFIGRFLDSDLRRRLQPPRQIIARSGINRGMRVLEVGCGSGSYTIFVARAVGSQGEVCALDIQANMLAQLNQKLKRPENQDIHNIHLYQNSAYELPFDDNSFDVVYMITVLQEIPDRKRALAEAFRVLKSGGKLAVTEWLQDPDFPLKTTTIRLGKEAGFKVEIAPGNLWTYTVRFEKPGRDG
jgi:ubiquinone/menaquinone biosynthesis C-methylase UbiE